MKKDLWRRAEELFHSALERPPEARRAFLDEACGEDAELRRQVEMLVSKDEQAGSFLEKPALADLTGFSLIGQTISHYRIIDKLGQEGWASSIKRKMPGSSARLPSSFSPKKSPGTGRRWNASGARRRRLLP